MTLDQIKNRLIEFYPDSHVEVFDMTGTADHWEVYIESQAFAGLSRIEQHQHVMRCFDAELKTGEVHALSVRTKVKN